MPNMLDRYKRLLIAGVPEPTVEAIRKRREEEQADPRLSRSEEKVPTAADLLGVKADKPKAKAEDDSAEEIAVQEAPEETLEEVLAELDSLVGMDGIKKNIRSLINLLKIQEERKKHDLPTVEIGLHQAYLGNPGVGKTTIARLIGRLYRAIGRLSKGQLVETDRAGLVGGYVGQTAIKTTKLLEAANGGVLFIDEAYSLVPESGEQDFGQEAITTILKFMEDNRDDFVLIVAGYPNEMNRFLDSNPGLVSRFNSTVDFPDYTEGELYSIFELLLKKNNYVVHQTVKNRVQEDFGSLVANKGKNFSNGRLVRRYFETAVSAQADRLAALEAPTKAQLRRLVVSDLPTDLSNLS